MGRLHDLVEPDLELAYITLNISISRWWRLISACSLD